MSGPGSFSIEPRTSTDPADFADLSGRDEVWRFSPLASLRPEGQDAWNADGLAHNALCEIFNRFGIACLRISKPYHDIRRPADPVDHPTTGPEVTGQERGGYIGRVRSPATARSRAMKARISSRVGKGAAAASVLAKRVFLSVILPFKRMLSVRRVAG